MTSGRMRRMIVGLILAGAFGAGGWVTWRAVRPSPAARPGPVEFSEYDVVLDGRWVILRNTGSETLAPVWVQFEADLDDSDTLWYAGVRRFDEWGPGQEIRIGIPGTQAKVRAVRFEGGAASPTAQRVYQFRFGEPLGRVTDGLPNNDVGFDPDLAGAGAGPDRP